MHALERDCGRTVCRRAFNDKGAHRGAQGKPGDALDGNQLPASGRKRQAPGRQKRCGGRFAVGDLPCQFRRGSVRHESLPCRRNGGILTKINAEKNFFEKGTKDYEAKIEILEDYNTVNKWVNEKTNGKIKSIIENLSPDVMIVLLNAIYFEAFWKEKFNINHTYEKEFFNIDNTKIYINLMFLRGKPLNYYEDDIIKAVKLDYDIKDNSINAIVILPKNEDLLEKNMNELIENLNEEIFYKIVDKLNEENSKTKVNLYLPKFEIENNFNISEILKNLGMVKAFMKEAEFKGISTKLKLFINKVLQKNYINVNEDGTQACSITELEVMLESYLTKDETAKDFIANRPFLFILRNEQCPKGHDIIFFTKVCKFNKVYNN